MIVKSLIIFIFLSEENNSLNTSVNKGRVHERKLNCVSLKMKRVASIWTDISAKCSLFNSMYVCFKVCDLLSHVLEAELIKMEAMHFFSPALSRSSFYSAKGRILKVWTSVSSAVKWG